MAKGVYQRVEGDALKERLQQLKRMQALPLHKKIALSLELIKRAWDTVERQPAAILYSGGKDSTTVLHLVHTVIPKPIVIYNNTGLAEPELVEFIRRRTRGLNYKETAPKKDAWAMWNEKGYWPLFGKRSFTERCRQCPGLKVSPVQCCYQLKEAPANEVLKEEGVRVCFWGNRADESERRKLTFCDSGTLFKPKKYPWHQCYPLAFWTRKDVLDFLAEAEPDYPHSISAEAGCRLCCTDITRTPNNIQRLFQKDRKTFDEMILRGFGKIILKAKGIEGDVEKLLKEKPAIFFRV